MSRNALALVDCSSRDKLFHYLINTFDRKSTKKEMISPYDDQLIGKMNFRHSGVEHAMFFTYARSSEYPGMKFRNHKVIYLSLDVNDISSDIFNRICTRFGGYIIYDDDLETDWQKIDRQHQDNDDDLSLSEDVVAERSFLFDTEDEGQERKVYRELKLEPDVEEETEEREWAPPVEEKTEKKPDARKQDRKQDGGREKRDNARNHKVSRSSQPKDKAETKESEEQKSAPKITVRETLRSHERQKEQKEHKKNLQPKEAKQDGVKEEQKEAGKESAKPNHRRGHRGGRKHSSKNANKEQNTQNNQTAAANHKPQA